MLLSILSFITQEKFNKYVYEFLVIQEGGLQELLLIVMRGYTVDRKPYRKHKLSYIGLDVFIRNNRYPIVKPESISQLYFNDKTCDITLIFGIADEAFWVERLDAGMFLYI